MNNYSYVLLLIRETIKSVVNYLKNEIFDIFGMTCSNCSSHVEKAVSSTNGVKSVNVNLLTNSMKVTFDDSITTVNEIISSVENAGYSAKVKGEQKTEDKKLKSDEVNIKRRLIASIVFLVLLMIISMGSMVTDIFGSNPIAQGLSELLLLIPIVIINKSYFINGFKAVIGLSPNMDTLIAMGASVSIGYSLYELYALTYQTVNHSLMHSSPHFYFEAAGMILTFITIGKYLESKSKSRTSDAITKLVELAPKTALIEKDGKETEVSVEKVSVGDIIIVKNGMSIPCDGIITEGFCSVDESAITGESIPADKTTGDEVTGGTIIKSGYIKFCAKQVGSDTVLSKIITLVEDASATKAPIARLADKVAKYFVPGVVIIALITLVVWCLAGYEVGSAISFSIAVLVISCPCALGLATPTAIMVGTGKAAQNGILIKSAETLETAGKLKTIVFDKTGTITYGRPKVTDVKITCDIDENEFIKIAVSLEKMSEHPLAKAVCDNFPNIKTLNAENFENKIGSGVSAVIENRQYFSGNIDYIKSVTNNIGKANKLSENFAKSGKTPLIFADENNVLGIIAVADEIKTNANAAINELENMGINTVMLTGDNEFSARAVQEKSGIRTAYAKVLPQDKEEIVSKYKSNGKVAMVGDGINDSPALASADIGIAIGTGTDIAIEAADAVLMRDDLNDVVTTVKLSRATIKNIKENLFWAFIYNVIFIPFAAGVFYPSFGLKLDPMYGTIAMSLSSICVVLNALRLKGFKNKPSKYSNKNTGAKIFETIVPENRKEVIKLKKVLIDGMMCEHCKAHVSKALNSIEGVNAEVNLETGIAEVKGNVSNEEIINAVAEAGYTVTQITE